jgi:hypothetical protein
MAEYVRYSDSVEVVKPEEQATFDEIATTLLDISKRVGERQRHTVRSVHAKSHGLLKAELAVTAGLPEELRQGLFATETTYPVIMRFSTNPGDILPDSISTPRGLALKVIGPEGAEMVPSHAGERTQDFVMVNAKEFTAPDAAGFLKGLKVLDKHATDSEGLKQVVSTTARLAETALEAVGGESATIKGFGHPSTHPLGETFGTLVPLRFGDYIAKLELAPVSENLVKLHGTHLPHAGDYNSLRDSIVALFAQEGGTWELRAQLCTNLETMPVEDASAAWSEKESPYVTVATLTAAPQAAYSDARRVFVDEMLSFNPWHCLAAHRPLGNVMRARFKAYQASSKFRHAAEGRTMVEPKGIEELPE